jgi:hypothetical protein
MQNIKLLESVRILAAKTEALLSDLNVSSRGDLSWARYRVPLGCGCLGQNELDFPAAVQLSSPFGQVIRPLRKWTATAFSSPSCRLKN